MSDKLKDLLAKPVEIKRLSLVFQDEWAQLETLPPSSFRKGIEDILTFWESPELPPTETTIKAVRNLVESLMTLNKVNTPSKPDRGPSPPMSLPDGWDDDLTKE